MKANHQLVTLLLARLLIVNQVNISLYSMYFKKISRCIRKKKEQEKQQSADLKLNSKIFDLEKEFIKVFDELINHHIAEEHRSLSTRKIKSKCPSNYGKEESKKKNLKKINLLYKLLLKSLEGLIDLLKKHEPKKGDDAFLKQFDNLMEKA